MIPMKHITLLTDFGYLDGYPGVMKGVIYSISPTVQVADITHSITPQNIQEGALVLFRSYRYFPAGTIHVAVIDPGVGTNRRPIAMQLGDYFFVGPDNGLFSPIIREAQSSNDAIMQFIHLNRSQFWLPNPSRVFHGRDIFAPVAAHLASGVPLDALGDPIDDPVMLQLDEPVRTPKGWIGKVIAIDHFGNLSTNITETHLAEIAPITITVAGQIIEGLVKTFGERPPGELIALIGTDHDLSISVVNGDAKSFLGAKVGDEVVVEGKALK